jgi:hypothetical protein
MTNQTMRDCRALVDGRIAMARQVVVSQCVLVETLRQHGQDTRAAEKALAAYREVRVLRTPRDELLRSMYDTLSFFAPGHQMDEFVPARYPLASPRH